MSIPTSSSRRGSSPPTSRPSTTGPIRATWRRPRPRLRRWYADKTSPPSPERAAICRRRHDGSRRHESLRAARRCDSVSRRRGGALHGGRQPRLGVRGAVLRQRGHDAGPPVEACVEHILVGGAGGHVRRGRGASRVRAPRAGRGDGARRDALPVARGGARCGVPDRPRPPVPGRRPHRAGEESRELRAGHGGVAASVRGGARRGARRADRALGLRDLAVPRGPSPEADLAGARGGRRRRGGRARRDHDHPVVAVPLRRRSDHVEVVLRGHVVPEDVAKRGQHHELVLRPFFQVQPAQRHRAVCVGRCRVDLPALRVKQHDSVFDRGRVEVAVEGDLDRVGSDVDADHRGALTQATLRATCRVVDQEVPAGRVADEHQGLLVLGDVDLAVGEHQSHDKPHRVRLRRDLLRCQDVVAGEARVACYKQAQPSRRVVLLPGVVQERAGLIAHALEPCLHEGLDDNRRVIDRGRLRRQSGRDPDPQGAAADERERAAVRRPQRRVVGAARKLHEVRAVRPHLLDVGVAAEQDRVLARPTSVARRQRRLCHAQGVGDDDVVCRGVEEQRAVRRPAGERGVGLAELRALAGREVENEQVLVLPVCGVATAGRDREHAHRSRRRQSRKLGRTAFAVGVDRIARHPHHRGLRPTHERGGHRWGDLIRAGKIEVLTFASGKTVEITPAMPPALVGWAKTTVVWVAGDAIYTDSESGPAKLAALPATGAVSVLSISPGGGHAAYRQDQNLFVLDLATGKSTQLGQANASFAGWSPDGTLLLYSTTDHIVVADTLGVTQSTLPAGDASWSSQDAILLGSDTDVEEVRPDGTNLVKLSSGTYHSPLWAPDGSSFAFVRGSALWVGVAPALPPQPTAVDDATIVVKAFMEARLKGVGDQAGTFLDDTGKKDYATGGLSLLITGDPRFTRYYVLTAEQVATQPDTVRFVVRLVLTHGKIDVAEDEETLVLVRDATSRHFLVDHATGGPQRGLGKGAAVVSVDVAADTIKVTFDSDLDPATVKDGVVLLDSKRRQVDTTASYTNRTVTLSGLDLKEGSQYKLVVLPTLRDVLGHNVAAEYDLDVVGPSPKRHGNHRVVVVSPSPTASPSPAATGAG